MPSPASKESSGAAAAPAGAGAGLEGAAGSATGAASGLFVSTGALAGAAGTAGATEDTVSFWYTRCASRSTFKMSTCLSDSAGSFRVLSARFASVGE